LGMVNIAEADSTIVVDLMYGKPDNFTGKVLYHAARGIFHTSNHRIVFPASVLCGASVLLICDCLSQVSLTHGLLPINAVTALFGAPIICWIIIKKQ
jgi:ABC-type cobalamin transport system, permease component